MARTKRSTPPSSQAAAAVAMLRNIAIATSRKARAALGEGADVARARTVEAVSKLEKVFQARVAHAIGKLGVPSPRDVRALSRKVAELQRSVDQLRRTRA